MKVDILKTYLYWQGTSSRSVSAALKAREAATDAMVSRRRDWSVGLGVALLAFVVYVWTLCPGVFPGVSAVSSAGVLQLLPGNPMIGHPLWAWSARLAAALPIGDLPFRLNLFSAVCGAGVVALVFHLTCLLLYEALRDEVWVVQMESDGEAATGRATPLLADTADRIRTDRGNHLQAMAGGIVAALAFAFCVPFWSAAVSLHMQTFDLLLFLAATYMLARYALTGLPIYFIASAFLCGTGLVESVAFVILLPAMLGIFFYIGKCHAQISESFIVLLLFSLGTGLLLSAGALVLWMTHGGTRLSGAMLASTATALIHSHGEALKAGLPRMGWLLLVFQGVVPVLTVYWGARSFFFTRDGLSRWSWGAVNTLFTALAAIALFNLPGSCWRLTRDSTHLPVMPLLGMAMSCGGLFVYGILLGRKPSPDEVDADAPPANPLPQVAGKLLAAAVALIVIVAPFRNFRDADGRNGASADAFCRELIRAAPTSRCLVTDGTFDAGLLVRAHAMRRSLVLVSDRPSQPKPAAPGETAAQQPAPTALAFVRTWLENHAGGAGQVAMVTAPGLWGQAGFQAVPNLLVYSGEKQQEKISPAALLERHRVFWRRIEPLLATTPPRVAALYRNHIAMKMQASRIANDLGVLCLYKNALPEAADAFRHAQVIDENNLCAFVNLYGLYSEHPEIGSLSELQDRMTTFAGRKPAFDSMAGYESCYGTLHHPTVEYLVTHSTGQGLPNLPGQPNSGLLAQLTEYCRTSVLSEAAEPSASMACARGAQDEDLASAAQAAISGKWRAAEAQLRSLTQKKRSLLAAWALLAEVLMNTDRFDEVETEVLPAMRLAAHGKDTELVDLTEGCLALRRSTPDYAAAHACFSRVLQRNPDIEEAQNQLLQASLALGDRQQIETDCTNLLARTPGQPTANALLGSLRLSQGRLEDAEAALNASIATRPAAPALNDLAETLRQTKRLRVAEAAARRAILLNPGFYQAWDTLAVVLADAGHLDDAAAAHQAALRLCRTDIRLYLSAASLEKKRNHPESARSLLAAAAPMLTQANASSKAEYNALVRTL